MIRRTTHPIPRKPTAHAALRRLLAAILAAIPVVLIAFFVPLPQLSAQASAAVQSPAPLMLHINILEGEDALNNIRQRTAREPIVQVEDENHKPVAGAVVLFTVHGTNGAGGVFATPYSASTTFRTVTNANGQATGRGFTPNSTSGSFTVTVTASLGPLAAVAVIHMTNSLFGGTTTGDSSSTNASGNPGSTSSSQPTSGAGSQTASTIGGGAGGAGGFSHILHAVPKWVVVGVVTGVATTVAVVASGNASGASISAGGGTVTAPH